MFNNLNLSELSDLYKKETLDYVGKINQRRAEGARKQWENRSDLEFPVDNREVYAEDIYKTILDANREGWTDKLRTLFPPQIDALYSFIENKNSTSSIQKIITLNKTEFLVIIHRPQYAPEEDPNYMKRECYIYDGTNFKHLSDITLIGICPQKKILAYVQEDGIHLKNRLIGEKVNFIPWEIRDLYFPDGSIVAQNIRVSDIFTDLCTPFSNGQKVLLGGENNGLFLYEAGRITAIFPDKQYCEKLYKEGQNNTQPTEGLSRYPMLHFSLSHDNKYIALGYQHSSHLVYDCDGILINSIEPLVDYPHYSLFSKDDRHIAFNSCHFYRGCTMAVKFSDLKNNTGPKTPFKALDTEARVYAAVATSYGYIIGDAYGYIRARSYEGEALWEDYLGFTIKTIDITDDEKFIYVGTSLGVIHKIELSFGTKDPYTIGDSNNREVCRWMFWERDTILKW